MRIVSVLFIQILIFGCAPNLEHSEDQLSLVPVSGSEKAFRTKDFENVSMDMIVNGVLNVIGDMEFGIVDAGATDMGLVWAWKPDGTTGEVLLATVNPTKPNKNHNVYLTFAEFSGWTKGLTYARAEKYKVFFEKLDKEIFLLKREAN